MIFYITIKCFFLVIFTIEFVKYIFYKPIDSIRYYKHFMQAGPFLNYFIEDKKNNSKTQKKGLIQTFCLEDW